MPKASPLDDPPVSAPRELTGWGSTMPSSARVTRPAWDAELEAVVREPSAGRGIIARGLGRSYGDAAQNAGGLVVDTTLLDRFELGRGGAAVGGHAMVRASSGTSLDRLMRVLVPRGYFVPVTPGTRFVTVGGAIAADIHGKNHHRSGSWCNHVSAMTMALPTGEVVEVAPDSDGELFWATAGGMGLTGVVVDATFRCPSIETSRLLVDTERTADLDELMATLEATDDAYDYSVAWIDLIAGGRSLGRSVLTRGRFARLDELDDVTKRDPLAFDPTLTVQAPPIFPSGMLNRLTIRAFNELWYRRAPKRREGELQSITQFFHPLDMVDDWNRMYGPRGFLQWQFVVPFGAEDTMRLIVERLSSSGCTSFLAVLKRFGPADPGPLSFPAPGWTLALDIPVGLPGLAQLLDELDDVVAGAGGRLYLAKDSRLRADLLPVMYPRLGEWMAVRRRVDPQGKLQSDLGRRLALC